MLPLPLSPLIGRRTELDELGRTLEARLVTLTGAGGIGKTRLALEAAAREADAGRAVAWVDLAPLADSALLPDHVAAALDVRPAPGRTAAASLAAALHERDLLLVLDNCEHLLDACAPFAHGLLLACPALRILATSREPLRLPGERLWPVPPLTLPPLPPITRRLSAAEAAAADAVQLFAARARESRPSFRITDENADTVAAVCRRLDGLPLALELAAARTRALSVTQIGERLDDAFGLLTTGGRTAPPRQRTLRDTFDWSFALLDDRQQILLRRLAVFAGTFSLEAVEEVCAGDGLGDAQVLDHLAALVDRSLVLLEDEADTARYRLLETVRQYSGERLRAAGEEEALRRRHAAHFVALAEELAPALFGGEGPPPVMERLDREHDNFRAAADWTVATPQGDGAEPALRLATAIHWYWFARGLFEEGRRRLAAALALGGAAAAADPGRRARAQVARGVLSIWLGRPEAARAEVAEAVAVLRTEGDPAALGYGLAILGAVNLAADPAAARSALAEARAVVAPLPPSVLTAFTCYWQGLAAAARGEVWPAVEALEEGLAVGRALGHLPSIGYTLNALGSTERLAGDPDAAHRHLAEGLAVHARAGDRWGLALDLKELAWIARDNGHPRRAARLLAAGRQLGEEVGIAEEPAAAAELERLAASLREALGEDAAAAAAEAGRGVRPDQILELIAGIGPSDPVTSEVPVPRLALLPDLTDLPAETGAALQVAALGPLQIRRGPAPAPGAPITPGAPIADGWSSARTRELLVFLLLHPDGATKEEIGLALWPDASATQVRSSLHVALHRLRRALGGAEQVRLEAGRYLLAPGLAADFDVPRFERGVRAALGDLDDLEGGRDAASELAAALALYRGELLAGEPAGEWAAEPRERLHQLYLEGLEAAAGALTRAGRPAEAAEVYRRWIAADDLCEEAYRGLMASLAATGERTEALAVYRRLGTVLARELDVEPEPTSTALYERLRQGS